MKRIILSVFVIVFAIGIYSFNKRIAGKPVVLVFSKTAGYHHSSISVGIPAIQQLGKQNNFDVDTASNADLFTETGLKKYAAIVFLNTTGNLLNEEQQSAFEKYIQAGGGYVGVHAATDAEYEWPWYGKLSGAYFAGHPKEQKASFIIKDKNHPATRFFEDTIWKRKDELYNFRDINPDIQVLITIDEKSYEGGINGAFHPMAWYHDFDGGRAFYTEMGHVEESYKEKKYLQHLLGGIQYAIGNK